MRGIQDHPSANFGPRRGGVQPDLVVLHYTGMENCAAALARLCNSGAEVSAHYLVTEDGQVLRLVDEADRAWHAGIAAWGGVVDVNSRSIGIEIANPGHELGYPPFAEPQMAALEDLLAGVLARHAIPPERVVGHACVAPGRKRDPGEKFDWRRMARRGLSVWHDAPTTGEDGPPDAARFQVAARCFGYSVPETGEWCAATRAVWQAYAMRFLPWAAGNAEPRGIAHLEALAERWPCRQEP